MHTAQPGILAALPQQTRYLDFELTDPAQVGNALAALRELADGERLVVGIGQPLVRALDANIPGLRTLPARACNGFDIPSTPRALWCWLRGDDRGELFHLSRRLIAALAGAFRVLGVVDGFKHDQGRDLSGYIDGTENPQDEAALAAALVGTDEPGLAGSSFVGVQLWEHDFDRLEGYNEAQRDDMIGRRHSDNEELDDAPPSAHVKRTAQEDFEPPAFMLRRSMPWVDGRQAGFMFVGFVHTLDAFQASLDRMSGLDDGITDALFLFTRPRTGAYFWCPPMREGQLDLRALGL